MPVAVGFTINFIPGPPVYDAGDVELTVEPGFEVRVVSQIDVSGGIRIGGNTTAFDASTGGLRIGGSTVAFDQSSEGDLTDGLTAAWTFNGDINDQAGSNNLTVSGTETYYSGSAFQFDGLTYLSHANSTALQAPDKFTIAVVFHCAGNGVIVGKFADLSTDREYLLRRYTEEGTPYLNFTVDNQAVLISDAVNTDNSYLAIAWNDPSDAIAGQGLWVQNLNGDPATESTTNGATALLGTSDFYVGGYSDFQIASDTRIDALYYWKGRILSGDERAALFNNGIPLEYPFS